MKGRKFFCKERNDVCLATHVSYTPWEDTRSRAGTADTRRYGQAGWWRTTAYIAQPLCLAGCTRYRFRTRSARFGSTGNSDFPSNEAQGIPAVIQSYV